MSRRPAAFRESDLVRALKAARKAGVAVAKVQIAADGRIELIFGRLAGDTNQTDVNPWDEVLTKDDQD
jgi:hypothetical protein